MVIPGKQKNSKIIVHDEFGYNIEKTVIRDDKKIRYLRCSKFPICTARGVIQDNQFTSRTLTRNPHVCKTENGVDSSMWRAKSVFAEMKEQAEQHNTSIKQIYDKALENETADVRSRLPYERTRKQLHEARTTNIPAFPQNVEIFIRRMEAGEYPPRFSDIFLGHVRHENCKLTSKHYYNQ